ncbi:uncharacterized protein PGTG_19253 [Puccinia graminis f. sp. tritici CRL 75-36-700-3]|uniref:Uncharacterized protein n=1 Tax=Puccinia graminis f. sp. tritici (strain CRL 75-36-700-3 / race SCCL) TaxID=418459 RepID=E3LA57_PUCGT|nr:uncharacterized protein PGTG_19253 [Puccinia graminis f. sp. tritici CRL 75-36-700-3]EFP93450.2 hypothetical protein PGTG_19253 [Puccinia graminis f. sp. tritici CRL 75-36-700-3]
MTPVSTLSVEKGGPPLCDEDLIWEQKRREADELNARIEALRQAGMPSSELPSPVLLPIRPLSKTRTDKPNLNCVPPRDYPVPPLPSFPTKAGLRRQASKKSLHSISSHHSKSPAPPLSQPNQNRDRTASVSDTSYYSALKEAEGVISSLRKSHDDLLEKVTRLENQLDLKEAENQDLTTRNNRLETYLVDEQKAKENIQRENERAMNQLRLLSRSQPPHPLNRGDPPSQLHTPAEPSQSLHGHNHLSPSGSGPLDQKLSQARAELLRREENAQKQYAYRTASLTSELSGQVSTSGHSHPSPAPMSKGSQPQHHRNLYEPTQPSGYQFPPNPQHLSHPFHPEEAERLPESRKLELNAYLTKPTTQLARYPLLLEVVLKYTPDDHIDKTEIPKVVKMIRELLAKVNIETGKSENRFNLAQLDQQLVFRQGEAVDLRLREEGRELIYKGQLKKRGGSGSDSAELQVYLFDHALLMVKHKHSNKTDQLKVYWKPIPLELLTVTGVTNQEDGSAGGRGLNSNKKSLMTRNSGSDKGKGVGTSVSSNGVVVPIQAQNKAGFSMTINLLGRRGYSIVLWAPTPQSRQKWLDKIYARQAQIREQNTIFEMVSLNEGFFVGPCKVNCAVPFDNGDRLIFGNDVGVYLAVTSDPTQAPVQVIQVENVTQVDIIEEQGILLVLADKVVMTFWMDGLDPNDAAGAAKRARKVSWNASFFKVGDCLGRKLVCVVKAGSVSSTIKTLKPTDNLNHQLNVRTRTKPAFRKIIPANNSMSNPNDPNNNPSVGQQNNPPTVQNALGEIAVVMITMIMLAPSRMLKNHLELMLEVEGKTNFGKFLSKIFKAFYSILKNASFPSNWLNVNVISHKVILKLLEVVSKILQREFIPTTAHEHDQSKEQMNLKRAGHVREEPSGSEEEERFDSNLWSDFFVLNHGLLSSKLLIIEEYPPQKRRVIWKLAGDIRDEGSKIFRAAWESIGDFSITIGSHNPAENNPNQDSQDNPDLNKEDTDQLTEPQHQINEVTRCGGYQVQFVPGFIEPLLELCLSHHDELSSNAVIVLYSVIVSEFNLNRDFTVIADEIIDKLDNLLGSSPNENLSNQMDEMSRASFVGQLRGLFDHSPIIDRQEDPGQQGQQAGIEQALKTRIDLFLDSLTQFLDLLLSIQNLPPGDEYFHAAHGNFVEAGLALRLHADLHEWDLNSIVDAMLGLLLPKQTVFAPKEALYFRILDFLSKGKAWESGIQICKELQEQYEHVLFDNERLSEVLAHQSSLFLKITTLVNIFEWLSMVKGSYLAYKIVNLSIEDTTFCDQMHNKHPNAQILQSDTISTYELAYAEGQYLQITRVVAEPDRITVVFKNPEVSSSVVSYYEHNATKTFSHSKPFSKDNVDPSDTFQGASTCL